MAKTLKYFSYISRAKVEMLEAQLRRGLTLRGVRVVFPGLGDVNWTREQDDRLAERTRSLAKTMHRKKLVKTLDDEHELESSGFYRDESTWLNGLFSFKGDFSLEDETARVVSYLVWRQWSNSIILLAGSPENVLGEKVVRDGVWAYGTTGTWATIVNFAETNLRTDERNFVAVADRPARRASPGLPWADWDAETFDEGEDEAPSGLFESPRGLALAVICARYLTALSRSRIETVFRVDERLDLRARGPLPEWVRDVLDEHGEEGDGMELLRRCEAVYIGSPIYTAIV